VNSVQWGFLATSGAAWFNILLCYLACRLLGSFRFFF
jgi:hypothetical protein